MQLIKQAKFGSLVMDFYKDKNGEIWATRDQIGRGLNYSEPRKAIEKIHSRNEARFKGKSTVTKMTTVEGGRKVEREVILYNAKGITEICRWARTDKANEFFDWVTDVIEEIRNYGMYVSDDATHEQIKYNVNVFLANLDNYNVTKLYDLIEDFLSYHREKKTRLPYERSNKKRHGNRKYKEHIESMEEIRNELVAFLDAKINAFNNSNQAGLAQEYVRIKGMVEWKVENMRYRTAACRS